MRASLAGWGTAVPEQRLTNHDLEQLVDTSDSWIVERTGIRERRIAGESESTATLAVDAGAAAIKQAGLTPDDIDLLVIATCTPEAPLPHTGAFVGERLGLRCGSFDLTAACAGFLYGLVVGSSMIAAGGGVQRVLLVGAETVSRITDPEDRSTCILFGDGAAAFVLEAAPDDGPGLLAWVLGCDGSAAGLLEIPGGGSRRPFTAEMLANHVQYMKMAGPEVYRRAIRVVVESASTVLDRGGVGIGEIDWFVPHQANLRIIEAAAERLGIPMDRALVNIDRYGNTSAASIPLALAEAADEGRLADGDLLLLSGFGAGMTWGSAIVRWGRP
jgi:3-oxoacyl-[acyl-carrier-protein] synthase-3